MYPTIHPHRAQAEDVPEDELDEEDPMLSNHSSEMNFYVNGVHERKKPFHGSIPSSDRPHASSKDRSDVLMHAKTSSDGPSLFPTGYYNGPANFSSFYKRNDQSLTSQKLHEPSQAYMEKQPYNNELEMRLLNDIGNDDAGQIEAGMHEGEDIEEDSPYPEVRASVSNIDDPSMPVTTFRVLFLSFFLCVLAGAANTYLMLRYPAPTVTPILVTILAYPFGKFMAAVLPTREYHLPKILGGFSFSLNPGAFNIKEHAVISALVSISIKPSYIITFLVAKQTNFPQNPNRSMWVEYLYMAASRTIGFGLAGPLLKFLVEPASMLWPQLLASTTILNTLHAEEDAGEKSMSRMRWFIIIVISAFLYNFIPGLFIKSLSFFCWLCWIKPKDRILNIVTGINGMGLLSFSFDWSEIAFFGSPMVAPWWSECNFFVGFVIFAWLVMPLLYFTNTWDSAYFPFSGHNAYDKHGKIYQEKLVLDEPSYTFNLDKFKGYSPIFLSMGFIVSYFGGFASITSVLCNMFINHYDNVLGALGLKSHEKPDIHAKLMRRYQSVPSWWFFATFFIPFLLILVSADYFHFTVKDVYLIIAILLSVLYALPSGYVFAMTGQMIGTNILADVVGGYILPGLPQGFLLFKSLAVQTLVSCLEFTGNLKLGHYMKIPPKTMFLLQIVCTIITGCAELALKEVLITNVPDACHDHSSSGLTCWSPKVYFLTSLLWSAIGPDHLFAFKPFRFILWGLLAGALCPLLTLLIRWRLKKPGLSYVCWPIIFFSVGLFPVTHSVNFTMWFLVAFVFQYYIRKYYFSWWSKFNFVTANALDFGTVVSALIIFAIQLSSHSDPVLNWSGNTIIKTTSDAYQLPIREVPSGGLKMDET